MSWDAPPLWHSLNNIVGQAVDDWSMLHLGLLFLNESMLVIDNFGVLFHHMELLMREEFVEISIRLILVQDLWLKSARFHFFGVFLIFLLLDLGFFDQFVIFFSLKMLLMQSNLIVCS